MTTFKIEQELQSNGYKLIAGVDEAGRGPLAGPVVAAAVILDCNSDLFNEIDDSKKLNSKKREQLYELIINNSDYAICAINNEIIDDINILNATFLSMQNSIKSLSTTPDYLLIDGNRFTDSDIPYKTIIKGDSISKSIAAASILAKVYRDNFMLEIDKEYPQYNFAKHKGYPTKEHYAMIDKYGICHYHRQSFLKKYFTIKNELF